MAKRGREKREDALETIDSPTGTGTRVQVRRARKDGWTKARRERFLTMLAETGNVTLSAEATDISKTNAYALRRRDPVFAERWDAAIADAVRVLEWQLIERAIAGDPEPVFYKGEEVGVKIKRNDANARFLISRHGGAPTGTHAHPAPGTKARLDLMQEERARARRILAEKIELAAERVREAADERGGNG